MRIQDFNGEEIHVGSRVLYGAPGHGEFQKYVVTVTEIYGPDVAYDDDEYGRERATGMYVAITVTWPDGTQDILYGRDVTDRRAQWECGEEIEEVFEESGDLEVLF